MSRKRSKRKEPKAEKAYIGGYIDEDLKEAIQAIAVAEDRSVNWVLGFFLAEGVKHRKGKTA